MTPTQNSFGSQCKTRVVTAVGRGGRSSIYMANRMRKATIKQKRPIASDRANPKIAYENNCCFRDGFLQERKRGQGSLSTRFLSWLYIMDKTHRSGLVKLDKLRISHNITFAISSVPSFFKMQLKSYKICKHKLRTAMDYHLENHP